MKVKLKFILLDYIYCQNCTHLYCCVHTDVSRLSSDRSHYCNQLLLLLSGVTKLTHHGIIQKPCSSGITSSLWYLLASKTADEFY